MKTFRVSTWSDAFMTFGSVSQPGSRSSQSDREFGFRAPPHLGILIATATELTLVLNIGSSIVRAAAGGEVP